MLKTMKLLKEDKILKLLNFKLFKSNMSLYRSNMSKSNMSLYRSDNGLYRSDNGLYRCNMSLYRSNISLYRSNMSLHGSNMTLYGSNIGINISLYRSNIFSPPRHHSSSALFITGDKASTTYAVLTPYIDFEERLDNIEELQRNVDLRGLCYQIRNIAAYYYFYKQVIYKKEALEITRSEVGKKVSALMKDEVTNHYALEQLKTSSFLAKHHHKSLRDYSYTAEEIAMSKVLALPNVLHGRTPHEKEEIIYSYLNAPNYESKSHIDLAVENDLIEYHNPTYLFLKNQAALFDITLQNYFQNNLISCGYVQFSNCDFARSIIVEGCGTDFHSKFEAFTLEDPHDELKRENFRTHLTGGASLYSFMANFTKFLIQPNYLPLKLFSCGRIYKPVVKDERSLLNTEQIHAVTVFAATADNLEIMDKCFDEIVEDVKKIYNSLGYHYRMVYLAANQIDKSESLRLSIEMYSGYLKKYVEVGSISVYDQYLSKRLLFTYNLNKGTRKFPCVISGTVLNVQKMLACVLEDPSVDKGNLLGVLKDFVPF